MDRGNIDWIQPVLGPTLYHLINHLIAITQQNYIYSTCDVSLSLSLRFNGHFPGEPGLAGVHWSKGWWKWWWQLHDGLMPVTWRWRLHVWPVKCSTSVQYIRRFHWRPSRRQWACCWLPHIPAAVSPAFCSTVTVVRRSPKKIEPPRISAARFVTGYWLDNASWYPSKTAKALKHRLPSRIIKYCNR